MYPSKGYTEYSIGKGSKVERQWWKGRCNSYSDYLTQGVSYSYFIPDYSGLIKRKIPSQVSNKKNKNV